MGRTSGCLIEGLTLHFGDCPGKLKGNGALVGLQPTAKVSGAPRPTLRNLCSDSKSTSCSFILSKSVPSVTFVHKLRAIRQKTFAKMIMRFSMSLHGRCTYAFSRISLQGCQSTRSSCLDAVQYMRWRLSHRCYLIRSFGAIICGLKVLRSHEIRYTGKS